MIESLKVAEDRPQGWGAWARIAPWGVAALAVAAIAAASSPAAATGKLPGFIAGAILIALVIYAFIDYLRPLTEDPDAGLLPALLVLAALAVLKLVVMPYFPGFGPDVGDYQAWASQIATFGPAHTYQQGFFLDYPPGYLYGLWVAGIFAHAVGATGDFYRVIIQSPAIVADFALAILMYAFMRRGGRPEMAFIAMLMVALNPPLLFDTVVWGQSDSVMTFVTLLSIVAILGDQYEIAWGLAAIAVLVKPQGLMMLPVLGFWTMLETDFATWIRSGLALILVAIIGIAPFQIGHEWNWIIKLYTSTAAYYHETSVNAFNLMALLGGLRQADSNTFLGVSYLRARHEPAGAALRVRRVDLVARPHADAPAVRVVHRDFWILHGRAPDARALHVSGDRAGGAAGSGSARDAGGVRDHHDHLLHQPRLHPAHAQHRRVPGLARRACDAHFGAQRGRARAGSLLGIDADAGRRH